MIYRVATAYTHTNQEQCCQKSNYLIDNPVNQESLTNQSINCQLRGECYSYLGTLVEPVTINL
jgi:hypothetical protein